MEGSSEKPIPAAGMSSTPSSTVVASGISMGEHVRVTVHTGIGHLDGLRDAGLQQRCLTWFLQSLATE
jgi:hypothetical protein